MGISANQKNIFLLFASMPRLTLKTLFVFLVGREAFVPPRELFLPRKIFSSRFEVELKVTKCKQRRNR
jgi:hypothetical protein